MMLPKTHSLTLNFKPMDETFSLEQIKKAFWDNFHEGGEFWFEYLNSPDDNQESTDKHWEDFEKHLMNQIS